MVIDAVALLRAQAPAVAAIRWLGLLHGGIEAIAAALVLPRCAGAEMATERPRQTGADTVAIIVVEIATGAGIEHQLSIQRDAVIEARQTRSSVFAAVETCIAQAEAAGADR